MAVYYNSKRLHLTLGNTTPLNYEKHLKKCPERLGHNSAHARIRVRPRVSNGLSYSVTMVQVDFSDSFPDYCGGYGVARRSPHPSGIRSGTSIPQRRRISSKAFRRQEDRCRFAGRYRVAGAAVSRTDTFNPAIKILIPTLESVQKASFRMICPAHGPICECDQIVTHSSQKLLFQVLLSHIGVDRQCETSRNQMTKLPSTNFTRQKSVVARDRYNLRDFRGSEPCIYMHRTAAIATGGSTTG